MAMMGKCFKLSLLACVMTPALAWAEPVAQVVRLTGGVELIRDGKSVSLALGNALEPGDKIKTDIAGRVRVQLLDGSTVNIGSLSEFSILDVLSSGPGTDRDVGLTLWLGVVLADAQKSTPKSRFVITTPKMISAVRGTRWGIYSLIEQSDLVVLDGSVGVRRNIVSGESAVSLTRTLGVTVTDAGLSQITRWPPERVDALLAATEVPGPEVPFDLDSATNPSPEPIQAPAPMQPQPAQPAPAPEKQMPSNQKNCPSGQDDCYKRKGGDHDSDGGSDGGGGEGGN